MVGGVSVAWFVLAGVFLAVGAPVLTLVLVRRERKREAARAEVEDSVRMAAKVAEAQPASGAATEAAEPRKGE